MPVLELRVGGADPDFAEELLFALGANAVRQEDGADEPLLEPPPGATPLWRDTITCGYFDAGAAIDAVEAGLRRILPQGASLSIERRLIGEADWAESWKAHVVPLPFGDGRLWIYPSHRTLEAAEEAPGAAILTLDPGLAFGTGTHPSTALCLDWLARTLRGGERVLDYGCGSGILALAALKLGAGSALGVDIDPQALTASVENAARNGLAAQFRALDAGAFACEPFDVVVANILSGPLIAMAPRLTACVRSGGALVLAGLLEPQAAEVRAAYAADFELDDDARQDGWARVSGRRRGT